MRLHPQEVFLTIHDDPNPISTIVSGAHPPFAALSCATVVSDAAIRSINCLIASPLSGCVVLFCNEHKL